MKETVWNLEDVFNDSEKCLIILNCPINDWHLFDQIWLASKMRICVDGGANRLFEAATKYSNATSYTPDLIVGDFDSLSESTRQFYEQQRVRIHHDPDQYSTDYMKAFKHVSDDSIAITYGGLSGRLDQTTHTLYYARIQQNSRQKAVYIISENNVAFSLAPGLHTIHVDQSKWGDCCGILPIATKKANVSTTGLEWDLGGKGLETTSFDSFISSSNHIKNNVIQISTDEHVFFNVEIRDCVL